MQTHVVVNMCQLSHASQFCTRSHVNKKALDQYVNFSEQREELVRRRDESIAGEAKIQQLITTLDMRKDEAIERTFKVGRLQVNLHLLAFSVPITLVTSLDMCKHEAVERIFQAMTRLHGAHVFAAAVSLGDRQCHCFQACLEC